MQLKTFAAASASKMTSRACKILGRQGTAWPGRIAEMIEPGLLPALAAQVKKGIFVICGTNGKTTANNLLCDVLEAEGWRVACNRRGANMAEGVLAALAACTDLGGQLRADYACLEVDEAAAPHLFSKLKPDYMILTNLFRDQLDRYGELDRTLALLEEAIRQAPGMTLIVNADDPLCVHLAQKTSAPFVSYGIEKEMPPTARRASKDKKAPAKSAACMDSVIFANASAGAGRNKPSSADPGTDAELDEHEVREGRFCLRCGAPLLYEKRYYGQMGIYRCPACGFCRPAPDYAASPLEGGECLSFACGENTYATSLRGFYNLYNILAVRAALEEDRKTAGARPIPGISLRHSRPRANGSGCRAGARHDAERKKPRRTGEISHTCGRIALQKKATDNKGKKTRCGAEKQKVSAQKREAAFRKALLDYRPQFGRNEHFRIGNRDVILTLAKNPAGFNQNIAMVLADPRPKDILIVINDKDQDGIDVSWLWDVDFDCLAGGTVQRILASGLRAYDMQLRLKYVGIPARAIPDPQKALARLLKASPAGKAQAPLKKSPEAQADREKPTPSNPAHQKTAPPALYVLANYTALLPLHQHLRRLERR